jgi:hypothetical protein
MITKRALRSSAPDLRDHGHNAWNSVIMIYRAPGSP